MKPAIRKLALTAHVTSSVGWLGAVVVCLVLATTGLSADDRELARAAYMTLETIGWFVIVLCALAALVTGIVQALGTEWGLFRHYWITIKLVLTTIGTVILLGHTKAIATMSGIAADAPRFASAELGGQPVHLAVHAAGGLAILIAATTLSIYKPWGKTARGRRLAG